MTPDRAPVDFAMDWLRRRVGEFEATWDAMPSSHKRVLVLRCGGLSLKEVASHLGLTPNTVQQYAKAITETMRDVVDAGDVSALCWLYGYSRALQDIDARLARKQRGTD